MVKGKSRLAYLAGFFDGEGCITIQHRRNGKGKFYHQLWVSVVNTNRYSLEVFRFTFGGRIYSQPRPQSKPHWKASWVWQISDRHACECLKSLLPYLLQKQPQAQVAIEFQESKPVRGYSRLTDGQRAIREAQRITLQAMKMQSSGL